MRPRRRQANGGGLPRRKVHGCPQMPPPHHDPDLRFVDRQRPPALPLRRREDLLAPPVPSPDRLVRLRLLRRRPDRRSDRPPW